MPDLDEGIVSCISYRRDFSAPGPRLSCVEHPAPDLTFHDNTLGVHGVQIARIDGRSEPLEDVEAFVVDFEEGAKPFLGQPRIYQYTNEPLIEVFWRTLIVNRTLDIPVEQWHHSFKSWWISNLCSRTNLSYNTGTPVREYLKTIPNAQRLAEQDDTNTITDHRAIPEICEADIAKNPALEMVARERLLFGQNVVDWVTRRCLFRTSEGYYGLGPSSLAIGDEVWIMPRSHVPFILRKSPTGAPLGQYSFIGESYVHAWRVL